MYQFLGPWPLCSIECPGCLLDASWVPLGCPLGGSWIPLGASSLPPRCLLGPSWVSRACLPSTSLVLPGCLIEPWVLLGASWVSLGDFWATPGCFLVVSWVPLGCLLCLMGYKKTVWGLTLGSLVLKYMAEHICLNHRVFTNYLCTCGNVGVNYMVF